METDAQSLFEVFRKSGVLAFCPKCGATKSDYRLACKSCQAKPKGDDILLARSIMMSTQGYYMRSKECNARTPEENRSLIEREIIPNLLDTASRLRRGEPVTFDTDDEQYWVKEIAAGRRQERPKSLIGCLVALYSIIIILVILFLKVVFF